MSLEQEIKLVVKSESKLDLLSLGWLTEYADSDIEKHHLISTYYDTAGLLLSKQGLGLRLRQKDEVFLQTVKTSGVVKNGLHQRDEWEYELNNADWDLDKLKQTPLADLIDDPTVWSTLRPLFNTDFVRETLQLTLNDKTKIEWAYDSGQVLAGDLVEPIHEIELELKTGSVDSLRQFAILVGSRLDVESSNLSKAAQGYRLVEKVLSRG